MIKNTLAGFGAFVALVMVLTSAYALTGQITLTSIAQRADGIYFGITDNSGNEQILNAQQAKQQIERTCPKLRIKEGVFN